MRASFAVASCSRPVGAPMTEDEAGLALAEALKTDLVFRLDLLHQAGASKLILATVLMDLALQLTEAARCKTSSASSRSCIPSASTLPCISRAATPRRRRARRCSR
jgi:hypothetical protein